MGTACWLDTRLDTGRRGVVVSRRTRMSHSSCKLPMLPRASRTGAHAGARATGPRPCAYHPAPGVTSARAPIHQATGRPPRRAQERSWRGRGRDAGHLTEAPGAHLWRVHNAAGGFLACSPEEGSPAGAARVGAPWQAPAAGAGLGLRARSGREAARGSSAAAGVRSCSQPPCRAPAHVLVFPAPSRC